MAVTKVSQREIVVVFFIKHRKMKLKSEVEFCDEK